MNNMFNNMFDNLEQSCNNCNNDYINGNICCPGCRCCPPIIINCATGPTAPCIYTKPRKTLCL